MHPLKKWRLGRPDGEKTQEAVAKLLGVSAPEISRYESGKRQIPTGRISRVVKATGIPRAVLRPDIYAENGTNS